MELQLSGKTALVTGATSGIGTAIAEAFAREGAQVAIGGRSRQRAELVAAAIRSEGGVAVVAVGDLGTEEGVDATAQAALDGLGHVDILVNNAGGRATVRGADTFFDVTYDDMVATYRMNVAGAMGLVRALVPAMIERKWGRMIQISSGSGTTPTGTIPDYGAAKAALINFSLCASKALARTGVTSNTVSPGMIAGTDGLNRWLRELGQQQGWGDDISKSERYALDNLMTQAVDRMGRVDDIANAVLYLASPVADFITGANLRVSGGNNPSVN